MKKFERKVTRKVSGGSLDELSARLRGRRERNRACHRRTVHFRNYSAPWVRVQFNQKDRSNKGKTPQKLVSTPSRYLAAAPLLGAI